MRRTAMPARTAPLPRVAGNPRTRKPLRDHRERHVASNTPAVREDLTPQQRGLLWLRSGGRCEGGLVPDCAVRVRATGGGWQACHRVNRSQGGSNTTLSNRWVGCGKCHAWQTEHPAACEDSGHYLPSGADPTLRPIRLPWHDVVRLDETRTYKAVM